MRTSITPGDAVDALFRGLRMSLRDRELRGRIVVALIVNAIAFMALVTGLLYGAFGGIEWLIGGTEQADAAWYLEAWYWVRAGIGWVLRIAAVVGAMFIAPVLFSTLAASLLPVFHGPVFKAARSRAGGLDMAGPGVGVAAVIRTEVMRLTKFLVLSVLMLLLNLLPVIGSLAYMIGQFLLSARTLGWDLMSHHFELHGLELEQQAEFVKGHRSLVYTMGGVATLLCMIPVAQLLFITTNVAGAGVLSAWMDGAPRDAVG